MPGQPAGLYKFSRTAADVGAFTLDGQAAGLPRAYRLSAEAGAFGVVGQDVFVGRRYFADPAVGAFALDGQAAAFIKGFGLLAEAGAFALAGHPARIGRALSLSAACGEFVLDGQDAGRKLNAQPEPPPVEGVIIVSGKTHKRRKPSTKKLPHYDHEYTGGGLRFFGTADVTIYRTTVRFVNGGSSAFSFQSGGSAIVSTIPRAHRDVHPGVGGLPLYRGSAAVEVRTNPPYILVTCGPLSRPLCKWGGTASIRVQRFIELGDGIALAS